MNQLSSTLDEAVDRGREIAQARSELAKLAEQQGVVAVDEAGELHGSEAPDDTGSDDVDELLSMLREWRQEDLKAGGC